MLFNSFEFLIFYVAIVTLFFATAYRYRWMLLLAGSYYFYMCWKPEYVVLIMTATLVCYLVGIGLERARRAWVRKLLLAGGIGSTLSILFTFKYLDFFSSSLEATLATINIFRDLPEYHLLLPLGISFYTFQAIGYVVDVYRRATPVEKHLGIFALYVSFFPQLVAGPIERSNNLMPQFRRCTYLRYDNVVVGLRLILWGLFKKTVVADQLGVVVDTVYAAPVDYSGPYLLLATFFFAIQIYADFSGYSDIAIGTARIMGYDLMTNFRRPYLATSVTDFWRRWHISLSTWFRDYVYIPLGGNRVAVARWKVNILVVFILSGLWHGANWTFVVWGALHGAYMIMENATRAARLRLPAVLRLERAPTVRRALQSGVVFVMVLVGWVFFRAQSISEAGFILAGCFDWTGFESGTLWELGLYRFEMMIVLLSIATLFVVDCIAEFDLKVVHRLWYEQSFRWACYLAGAYSIVFFGSWGHFEFIYFQF